MSDVEFRSDVSVDLVQVIGNDLTVVQAARVSTGNDQLLIGKEWADAMVEADGLIRFLMKNRHGTPFEHNLFTFRIEAPIFVWREFMRHRVGFSYNEESGRYKQLDPVFYLPAPERNLIQEGKPGAYTFVPGTPEDYEFVKATQQLVCGGAYGAYKLQLDAGIAKEVARMVLPVSIFSTAYVTCNARSMMSFLSLRTKHEDSKFPSFPQREIEMVAEKMENSFVDEMPLTAASFTEYGRVSP